MTTRRTSKTTTPPLLLHLPPAPVLVEHSVEAHRHHRQPLPQASHPTPLVNKPRNAA